MKKKKLKQKIKWLQKKVKSYEKMEKDYNLLKTELDILFYGTKRLKNNLRILVPELARLTNKDN